MVVYYGGGMLFLRLHFYVMPFPVEYSTEDFL